MSQKTTPPEALREMGAEFHHAVGKCKEALWALEDARQLRLTFLREAIKRNEERLSDIKEEVRRLPEQIAKWEAERAHLEAQTGLDLLRAVVTERVKCDGNHAGPPCADRECWNRCERCRHTAHDGECRAEVEAMAEEAEQKPALLDLRTVRLAEEHADPDWVVADADLFDVGEKAETHNPSVEKGQRFQVERVAAPYGAPRVKIHVGGNQVFIGAIQPAHVEPRTPELLDLRKLKVGTVCEATASLPIPRRDLAFAAGQRFTIDGFDASALPVRTLFDGSEWWLPALVPARVVKEGQ